MSKHDQAALDAATEIMSLVNGPVGLGSDAKLKANIQVVLIDLLEKHATQPAAGEPEQQTAINADDLPTKKYPLGAFDFDAPVAAGEPAEDLRSAFEEAWSQAMCNDEGVPGPKPLRSLVDPEEYRGGGVKFAWRWFQRGAQSVAPPAAAHGDEAVLWEMLEELRTATDRQALPGAFIRVMWEAGCDWINARAAMRAQAGEGGE